MPIQTFKQVPRDLADWDRFFRQVPVEPDPGSVGEEEVQDGAITEDKIAPNAITNTRLRDSTACSVIGRSANTAGDPADIPLGEGEFLVRRSNVVTSSTILDADVPASIARDSEVVSGDAASVATAAAALAAHVAAGDPHPGYTTAAELSTAISNHEAAADPHTGYQKESEKDAASGYAGLNASSRTTKGVDTTDDLIVDLAAKGLVLKDTQGTPHYWRVSITTLGVLTTTDLGTTKP